MTLDANHTEKNELHLRNKHRSRYNFQQLCYTCKELLPHVFTNKFGEKTIDQHVADALKTVESLEAAALPAVNNPKPAKPNLAPAPAANPNDPLGLRRK